MSDSTTDLREEVRTKYAAAARAVLDASPADPGCCGPASGPCCGPAADGAGLADVFGPSLYRDGETDELPDEAVLASLGCGNPWPSPTCTTASGSWTWDRAAASMCCCPPAASARPGSPTAST
jgi:hypothetical protein